MSETVSDNGLSHIEPPCWWVGMNTELQLMLHGKELSGAALDVYRDGMRASGVAVKALHNAESPNYLFADIAIDKDALPGTYVFKITRSNGQASNFNYTIGKKNASDRKSFTSADMLYLIMPDRFANGDSSNDSVEGCLEKANYDSKDGRHGGDIKGIADHLDYLENLGVTALWSTPLLLDDEPIYSYHGYACSDYYMIDPRYGSNDDYKNLTAEAHNHGIKMVMDFVTNHCGTAHWWMKDLPFQDWIHQWPEFTRSNYALEALSSPNATEEDITYCTEGWFDTSMPDMNMDNQYLLKYFIQSAIWWIEWAGIDGLRVDTYPYNGKEEIAAWTKGVLNEYPRLTIVGECWIHSPAQVAYWQGGKKNYDKYDSHLPMVMDFPLLDAIWEAMPAFGKSETSWGEGLTKVYQCLAHDGEYADIDRIMLFLTNHDTDRAADLIDKSIGKGRPEREVVARMKLCLTLIGTLRGMPQLYVGDENMMRADGRGGDGSRRVDFPQAWFNAEGRTASQNELVDFTSRLFQWRKGATAIHSGKTKTFSSTGNLFVYFRIAEKQKVMVVLNASAKPVEIDWNKYISCLGQSSFGTDILSETDIAFDTPYTIEPMSSMVIEFK
ncbi:MAG: cyclomaltodextrinase N-terminal domain-containing protein [Bacteroidales bacterium]|nr:cyclomaltodextrinase N-terminal domain-containing protein [Bacteroidales bacterium]